MKRLVQLFRIRPEERWPAAAAAIYVTLLNVLVVLKYADKFTVISDHYHRLFVRTFHISGFDPLTYSVVSSWAAEYNIYRHPLLAFMMWLPNQLNQGIILLTGYNGAPFVVAALLTVCAVYSWIFLIRIFHEIVGIGRADSWLLGALTYSFAFVMLSVCVPDHFSLSMFMLILTLYIAGLKMQQGRMMGRWTSVLLFFLTAGISLNNGIKVLMAQHFVNGRRFWRPMNLLLTVALPCLLIWGVARWEWNYYEKPNYTARQQKRVKAEQQRRDRIARAFRDTTSLRDSTAVKVAIDRLVAQKEAERKARDGQKPWKAHIGKPMGHGEFSQWTDVSTPRWASIVENLMGESIQLHRDHLLEDTLTRRPVIVTYRSWANYMIVAVVAALFVLGVVCGRRSRFLWMAMSFLAFDLFIHVVLGFGLNEVYIMSAHWLFVFPIAMAYLVRWAGRGRMLDALRLLILSITLFLLSWNGCLFISYLQA